MTKSFRLRTGTQVVKAEKLCEEHLGTREYYLHHSMGGEKWRIRTDNDGTWLEVEDSPESLLIIMQL